MARREVAVVGGQRWRRDAADFVLLALGVLDEFRRWGVVVAGDFGEYAQLLAIEFAIRHGNPQHGRVALDVPTVLQA